MSLCISIALLTILKMLSLENELLSALLRHLGRGLYGGGNRKQFLGGLNHEFQSK